MLSPHIRYIQFGGSYSISFPKQSQKSHGVIIIGTALAGGAWAERGNPHTRFYFQEAGGDLYEKRWHNGWHSAEKLSAKAGFGTPLAVSFTPRDGKVVVGHSLPLPVRNP